jgi:hypothetical protein
MILKGSGHYRFASLQADCSSTGFHPPDFISKAWKIIGDGHFLTGWISILLPIGILIEIILTLIAVNLKRNVLHSGKNSTRVPKFQNCKFYVFDFLVFSPFSLCEPQKRGFFFAENSAFRG